MTILKRNGNLQSQVPHLFDDFLTATFLIGDCLIILILIRLFLRLNIKETADNYEVQVAAPGMTKSDFNVELEGNTLTISSEKQSENEQNQDFRYTTKEIQLPVVFANIYTTKRGG
jgi:HSP20 family protein